jgi:GDPmannose 4,6-dehydratase
MSKRALITGSTGQDGSSRAEFLPAQCYEVFGIVRRSTIDNGRIYHLSGQHPSCES